MASTQTRTDIIKLLKREGLISSFYRASLGRRDIHRHNHSMIHDVTAAQPANLRVVVTGNRSMTRSRWEFVHASILPKNCGKFKNYRAPY